ncbi:MAG: TolC family protein [Spirochaetes bacterium]|nr:TolC family protein [Spirochaetota bacterium]
MKKLYLITIFITLILFPLKSNSEKEILKYDDFIKSVKEELLELKINENELEFSKNKVKEANSMYNVDLNYYINGIGKKPYNDLSNSVLDYSSGFNTGLNLSATIPSGTKILIGGYYEHIYSNGYIKDSKDNRDYFNSSLYDPVITVQISQPLIYNWFGFIDRYARNDATQKLNIAKLKKEVDDSQLICVYSIKYYHWTSLKMILEKLKMVIDNATELEKQTLRKFQSNILGEDDYQKSVYNTLKYKLMYNNYQKEYDTIKNELKLSLNKEKEIEPDIISLDAKFSELQDVKLQKGDFYFTTAGKVAVLTKKNLEYLKKINTNKTLPKLNLNGDMDIKFHNYLNNSENIDNNTSYGDIDFIVGIDFVYPLGNHKARADYKNSLLLLEQFNLEEKIMLLNYEKSINDILNIFQLVKDNISLKNDALISLNKRLRTETIKFNNAEIDLNNLLDTRNFILTEEIELLTLKLNYIIINFEYLKLNK